MLFIFSIQYITFQERKLNDKIYPNVFIDGKNVGGKTKSEAALSYKNKNNQIHNLAFEVLYHNEPIATLSAEKLNIRTNGEEIVERAYLIGRSTHTSSRFSQKIGTLFNFQKYYFSTKIEYDKDTLKEFTNTIEDQYNKPARNALFTFENNRVVSFREDEKGMKMNSAKFLNDVDRAVNSFNKNLENKTIAYQEMPIDAEITLKNANNFGIEELIGEGKSNYTHSIPERIHNLTLAASKFHGILIPKGKTFSFNDTVGDISSLTGYQPAYIIQNGKTVLGDGGGICQVSTTLFRTAMNAGLPITDRTAHAYRVLYYENDSKPGFDATVYSPTVDLKFTNDTPAAILVVLEQDKENNILRFKFYGKRDGRKVELSDVKLYDEQPPPPAVYQDDPTLKKGVTKQVDFSAWGAKSVFTYKVTKQNSEGFEKTFFSMFKPWQAVYLVGTGN